MEEESSSIKENNQIPKDCVISWVSVKDALPKNRQKVLFATTNEDVHKAIYMEKLINQYGDYDQVFLSTDGGHYQVFMDIVTFWCDFPKAPPCH